MTSVPAPRPALDPERIATPRGWRVEITDASPSTNAVVAERARAGEDEGPVVVTEHQTAGRGRLDRVWETPARSSLTFSVLLRPDVPAQDWPWLPLLTGYAVRAALADRLPDIALKWPNDVPGRGAQGRRDPGRAHRHPSRPRRRRRDRDQRVAVARGAPGRPGHLRRARDRRTRGPDQPARPGARLPARTAGPAPRPGGTADGVRRRVLDHRPRGRHPPARGPGRSAGPPGEALDIDARGAPGRELGRRDLHRRSRRCDSRAPAAVT
ncbi:biotin--[acetyl-CoA-carboxylase] ligase [Nocardioides sp. B-3]|uniref:biotin--[acetyl-CoA-carboxylase] ligase n=1 Tax=Nocardioides sp. B-3 TaxID=2895565 RepID=UPI0021532F8F|nr:biotin--[acetyl-CoA-carboxylase] ligase [Nocardioides sp. B-3]UUZ58074.1 biotin--[acetyl-CoA-carboxylase] ligase [Nocardioides sp. B-3]